MQHLLGGKLPQLKLGIDGEALRRPLSGVGQYVFNLCRELEPLAPDALFFVYSRFPAKFLSLPSNRWTVRHEENVVLRRMPSFVWLKTRGASLCRVDELDVFWAGRTIHAGKNSARAIMVTIHDFNHRLVPKTMRTVTRWSHRLWFDRDIRSADIVLVNSQGTGDRLWNHLALRADAVIRPGLGPHFAPFPEGERSAVRASLTPLGVRSRYVLAVSTLEPRKNIEALVDAFVELKKQGTLVDHQLVLVGANGWNNKRLAAKIRSASIWDVVIPGYVPDALMPAVFACAEVLVMPSLYEGFGIPVLEARSMGTPVITTDVPELREAGGESAFLVEPTSASIAAGIMRVLNSPSRRPPPTDMGRWKDSGVALLREIQRLELRENKQS